MLFPLRVLESGWRSGVFYLVSVANRVRYHSRLMAAPNEIGFADRDSRQPQGKPPLRNIGLAFLRYGVAVTSVALALLAALFLQHYKFRGVELSLFLFAIALTVWYAGVGPAMLATVLSILCFVYFFSPPIYSFAFSVADVPAIVILLSFAVLIIRFSAVRRRIEGQLLQARKDLQADIDHRKKAEKKLRRSEAYLAEGERLSKTASWAWSPITRQSLYWSEEMFRIFGFDPQQGLPPAEAFWERVHPEDRDSMFELMRKAVHEKTEYEHEHRIVLHDGTVKHIRAIGRPLLNAEKVVEYMGTLVDVTDRKRAEQALRRSEAYLAEAQKLTKTGSWAWEPLADKVLYWSEEMFRIFGFDPEAGIPTGPAFGQRIHPDDHDKLFEYVQSSVRQRTDYIVNHRIVLPDGTVRHIETIGHPVLDPSGELVEYVGTAMDITERKHSEQERERLRQLDADLARLNRVSMMGELAASLAHEIKQPIAAATTNAQTALLWLQREPPDTGEAREALSRIVNDAKRAADIIERNRSLYRRDTPKRETVSLNEVVREMIALLQDAAKRRSVSIRTELDGEVPTLIADRVQMQQVLMNLMLNGIEAMKDTGGQLTIRSKNTEERQILLSVSDVGVGLPRENADRVFDAFFTTKAEGTGMGLSICRRIIESHGGRLWACANTERGSTFHFTLPTAASTSSTLAA